MAAEKYCSGAFLPGDGYFQSCTWSVLTPPPAGQSSYKKARTQVQPLQSARYSLMMVVALTPKPIFRPKPKPPDETIKKCGRNPARRTNSDASFCFVRKVHEESPKSRTGLHSFRTSHVPGPFSRRRPQGSPYKKARTQVLTPYGRPCEPFTVVFPTPKPVPRPNGQGQGSSFRQNLYRE